MAWGREMDPLSGENQEIRSRPAAPRTVLSQASLEGGRALSIYRAADGDVQVIESSSSPAV